MAIEVIISALEWRRVQWRFDYDAKAKVEIASASILIGLATLFAILTQLPPKTFNSHDDFEKYLAYPVRMLKTALCLEVPSALWVRKFWEARPSFTASSCPPCPSAT